MNSIEGPSGLWLYSTPYIGTSEHYTLTVSGMGVAWQGLC